MDSNKILLNGEYPFGNPVNGRFQPQLAALLGEESCPSSHPLRYVFASYFQIQSINH